MKKSYLLIAICLLANLYARGQSARPLAWSAILSAANGSPMVSASVPLRFSLIPSGPLSAPYVETQVGQTDQNGFVNIAIGQGTPVSGNFQIVKWQDSSLVLKIEADFGGGYELLSEATLKAVPYAAYSGVAGGLRSVNGRAGITETAGSLDLKTNDTTRLRITSEGNIQIPALAQPVNNYVRPVYVGQTGKLIDTAVVHHYNLSGADFHSETGKATAFFTNTGCRQIDTTEGSLVAAIHLPNRALIRTITVYYRDNSALRDMTFNFEIARITPNTSTIPYTFTTSGADPASVQSNTSAYIGYIVNNEQSNYLFRVSSGNWTGNWTMAIRAVVIAYEY